MATITGAQVDAELTKLATWFGPHTDSGVSDGVTEDDEEFNVVTDNGYTVPMTFEVLSNGQTARQRIIKTEVQFLGSAVTSGDYGPLELLSEESDLPWEYLDRPRIDFTTSTSKKVSLTYSELSTAAVRNRIISETEGLTERALDLKVDVEALRTITNAWTSSNVTQEKWQSAIEKIFDIVQEYIGEQR